MIKSFGDRDTERVFERRHVRRWSNNVQRAALRKLLDQWRVCFRWRDGANDVEIADYH